MATEPTPNRLTQLPGFDTSPDVYETPDLDDSTTSPTTTNTTSPRANVAASGSDTSSEEDDDEESYGVSRRRLYPERARHRFGQEARSIKTRGADLSDRVDGRRRGFRRSEKEDESLGERVARLRREVEECRVLAEKEDAGEDGVDEVEALGRLLAGLPAEAKTSKRIIGGGGDGEEFHDATENGEDDSEEEDMPSVQPLAKVGDFDSRLADLETALGLSSLEAEGTEATPLLPTLKLLDQQLATLNSATSLSALESTSSRIAALKLEAQNLSTLQHQSDEDSDFANLLSPDDMKQLQTLYALLPTLQTLAPTVPALVTRLRSLRTLHTTAASASADLDSIEQRQAEMDRELKVWRQGLEKVEKAVKDADDANGANGGMVKGWIDDLEGRVKALGR